MSRFYEKIIGCRNEGNYRIVTLFGIKLKYKNARRELLAESKKLFAQCTAVTALIKRLSDSLTRNHDDTTRRCLGIEAAIKELTDLSRQRLDKISRGTGDLSELEYNPVRYYSNQFERGFLLPFFDYMDRPDFEEKYLGLIRGMDASSICEINKILCRVNMVKAKPDQGRYHFYSLKEQEERTKLVTDFRNRILRVSDHLYAYDKYLLPINHFEVCVFLYKHGIELVRDKERVRRADIIDAGGFIGDSALVLSDYTDGRIYSFEANPQNLALLNKTLEINGPSKVIPVSRALWSSETELEFNLQGSCTSAFKLGAIEYREGIVKVPTVTLDSFVKKNNLRVGLIKVDLEGAELEFLKGAKNTIKSQKPVLLLSIYHKPSDFFELKSLLESWVPEYEFTVFSPVDWGILLETMIVAQLKTDENHE